ncbi:MAG: glycosyltransferase family 4 protein [bacterium]|nr:glycosyltransferase family 4 protein [bacterium]
MRIALGADLLDFPRCGMRIALEGFLKGARDLDLTSRFNLVHGAPFADGRLTGFTDAVVPRPGGPASGLRWSQLKVPRALAQLDADLLHWPYQILPPVNTPVPQVISVWDLSPMLFNEPTWSRLQVFVKYRQVLRRALNNAAHVIAHSRAIAEDLVSHFGLPADKLTVVYPSVADIFEREIERSHVAKPEGPLLYVGTDSTRKNLDLLFRAFSLLVRQGVRNQLALRIDSRKRASLEVRAERAGIPVDRLMWLEPVDADGLMRMYREASVFAFPSLYEGFGMPLLEALTVGLPVAALNRSAMTEVVGEAGVLVDDNAPEAFAAGLLEALRAGRENGADTAFRAKQQAAKFKWTKSVQETISVYEKVLGREA